MFRFNDKIELDISHCFIIVTMTFRKSCQMYRQDREKFDSFENSSIGAGISLGQIDFLRKIEIDFLSSKEDILSSNIYDPSGYEQLLMDLLVDI